MNAEHGRKTAGELGLPTAGRAAEPAATPAPAPTAALIGAYRTADSETLRRAYDRCRRTAAVHGRTYYLATRLLSAEQRPAVHALYAFARMVDDIVDNPSLRPAPAAVLDSIELALRTAWTPPGPPRLHVHSAESPRYSPTSPLDSPCLGVGAAAPLDSPSPDATAPLNSSRSDTTLPRNPAEPNTLRSLDPTGPSAPRPLDPGQPSTLPAGFGEIFLALTDTVARFAIDPRHFWTFLDSMRMDVRGSVLFRNRYPTMAALDEYMDGSAAAIGLQLLPVLGTTGPRAAAEPAAAALGNAFQLTNFLRDIAEDLDRDRIYLPADALAAFGVDEELLRYCRRTRRTDRRVRRALAHLIAVNRDLYRRAYPGIELLGPRVRPGIRTAAALYAAILDRIEESDYDVFARRAVVPDHRRLWLAAANAIRR